MPLTSEEAVRRATGRGWDDWLAVLDAWGAVDRPHGTFSAGASKTYWRERLAALKTELEA